MEKIRTNHMIVEFFWEEFLEDYDFFKIEYGDVDFDNITAVSYTHLDMYKRQLFGMPPTIIYCRNNSMALA